LAIVTLERDGFIESKLHEKWPEILDLCSVRLRKDAKIPDALKKVECSIEPVDEVEAIDGDITGMTTSLGVAFNSTFTALLLSIMLMFFITRIEYKQDNLIVMLRARFLAK